MNLSTEDLRKLAENIFDIAWGMGYRASAKGDYDTDGSRKNEFITSQLSALHGKGEGVEYKSIETYKEFNGLLKRQIERLEDILLRGLSESYRAGYFRLGFDKEKWIETNCPTTTLPPANQPTGMRDFDYWKTRALVAEERFDLYVKILKEIEEDDKLPRKVYTFEEIKEMFTPPPDSGKEDQG